MQTVNVSEAKTHLSRLVAQVAEGKSIIIARAGKPIAKLGPLDSTASHGKERTGFLTGAFSVPDDFDRMGAGVIAALFDGGGAAR